MKKKFIRLPNNTHIGTCDVLQKTRGSPQPVSLTWILM